MLIKLNTSDSSFSELTAQLRGFTSRKKQDFKSKLSNSKFLAKSKDFFKSIYKSFKRSRYKYEDFPKMTIVEFDILQIREEHPEIDNIIRSILLTRSPEAITIEEIRRKFRSPRFPC